MKKIILFLITLIYTTASIASNTAEFSDEELIKLKSLVKSSYILPSGEKPKIVDENLIRKLIRNKSIKIVNMETYSSVEEINDSADQVKYELRPDLPGSLYTFLPNFSAKNLIEFNEILNNVALKTDYTLIDLRANQGDTLNQLASALYMFSQEDEKLDLTQDLELNLNIRQYSSHRPGKIDLQHNYYLIIGAETDSGALSFIAYMQSKLNAVTLGARTGTDAAIRTAIPLSESKLALIPVTYLIRGNGSSLHATGHTPDIYIDLDQCGPDRMKTEFCIQMVVDAIHSDFTPE